MFLNCWEGGREGGGGVFIIGMGELGMSLWAMWDLEKIGFLKQKRGNQSQFMLN